MRFWCCCRCAPTLGSFEARALKRGKRVARARGDWEREREREREKVALENEKGWEKVATALSLSLSLSHSVWVCVWPLRRIQIYTRLFNTARRGIEFRVGLLLDFVDVWNLILLLDPWTFSWWICLTLKLDLICKSYTKVFKIPHSLGLFLLWLLPSKNDLLKDTERWSIKKFHFAPYNFNW